MKLFLYQNGPRADALFARALVRAIVDAGTAATVACCRDDLDLWQGLGKHLELVVSPFANTRHGSPVDLACLAPAGTVAFPIWLGGASRLPNYQWPDMVAHFQRQCERRSVQVPLGDLDVVPMLDFASVAPAAEDLGLAIYLDNARGVDKDCWFVHDVARLARALPEHTLLCTAPTACQAANVRDISAWSWAARSRASERCEVLVGTTRDPFALTMTETNRWKPKALCGHDARVRGPFWDYPGNPMELLATMDELVDFLLANVDAGCPR